MRTSHEVRILLLCPTQAMIEPFQSSSPEEDYLCTGFYAYHLAPMNKNITRIALTGGPCAGKTTALAQIIEHFSDLGYLVYALPETPTLFSNASINFATPNRQYFYNIEKAVMKYQLQMEDTFLELAHTAPQPVLIISDRGTMDISNYIERTMWQALLDELGLSEIKLRDARYDAVIHMVTAAQGAEEFYTLENNASRHETVEQARDLDARILKAWTGHPQLHIVENNVDFQEKIRHVLHAIHETLGDDPATFTDIRRRFLVQVQGEIPFGVETDLYQAYLDMEDGSSVRIRKRGLRGNYVYFVTRKSPVESQPIITERQIGPDEYISYLNSISSPEEVLVHKLRRNFVWAKQYFEVDDFIEPKRDYQILEISCAPDQEVKFPPFIEVIKEVTGDPVYGRL